MKAVTVYQPHASLIALGIKTVETRSKPTRYRGKLAIHASINTKTWEKLDAPALKKDRQTIDAVLKALGVLNQDGIQWPAPWIETRAIHVGDVELPLGAVVAFAELVDCVPIGTETDSYPHGGICDYAAPQGPHKAGLWIVGHNQLTRGTPTRIEDQRPFGDFTPGRYAYLLDNVEALEEPIPARGQQGLWNWEKP